MNLDEYVKTIEKLKGNYEATGDVMGNTGKKQVYGRQKKESQPVKPLSLKFNNISGGYSYDPNQSFFSPQNALASLGGDQEVREFKAKQAKEDAAYNLKRERRGWLGNAAADTVGALAKGAANAVKGIGYAADLAGEGVSRLFNPGMSDFERERTSNFSKEYREDWSERFDDFGNKVDKGLVSDPEKMTGAGKFFYETAQSIPTVIAGLPTLMASAAGSGMEKAETEGATPGQALLYGALAGGTEGALESALGVVPGLRNLKNITKGGIKGFLKTAAGEALEEALMPAIENAYAQIIYNPDQKIFNPQEMLRGGLSGAALTAMLAPFGLGGGNTDAATSAQKGIKILPSKAAEKPQTVQTGTNTPGQVEASTGQIGAKEPWQMTRSEYTAMRKKENPQYYGERTPQTPEEIARGPKPVDIHKAIVEQALKEGKTVPESVLSDYPDLRPVASTGQIQTAKAPLNQNSINVYRGYAISEDPSERNLSKQLTIMDVLGKPKQEVDLLPFEYYTESFDVAEAYANRDGAIVEQIMNNTGNTKERSMEIFKTLYGREPVLKGVVKQHTINPQKILDLSSLGEEADYRDAIKKLLEAEGSPVPLYTQGENVNAPKWDRWNQIERDIMLDIAGDNDTFPVYMLMKSKSAKDKTGRNFVNWLKNNGYDAVKYSEDGTTHYAVLKDAQLEASTGQTTTYQAATASPGTATMNINIPPTGPAQPGAQPGGLPPPANKVVMDSPKKKLSIKEALKKAYTNVVDTLQPIVDFSKKAGDKTSVLASNTRNVGGTVDFIFTEALTDRQGNKIGKSLKEVVGNIPEGQEEAFWMYMSQRHNIDRAREGKNVISNYDSNMSAQAVAQIEAANPNFKAIGDEITTWIDTFMQEWGVNAGIIDSQVYSDLRNMYKSYFPTQREFSQLEKSMPENVRKQFVDNASPIKTATGSGRDINNPVENIMNLVNRTVRTARYNDVGRSILDSVRKDPAGLKSYAEIVTGPSNTDNVISVLENGKTVYLQINDKALLNSLKGLPKVINNAKAMRWVTNKFKGLITQKNPFFALRNIFRDVPTAYTYGSEANPLKFGRDLLRAGKDIATNSDRYQRYKAVGGGMSNFFQGNAQTAAKKLNQKGFHPLKAIENFNNITETAPRLAEFNRVFDKTGDVQQALDAANNVTVNFARGGNLTKQAEAFVPYLNAGVQGLDRFFKAFKDPRTALMTLAKGGIMITAPEIILYLINRDREEYKQLDNRTKDMYYLIPTGDTFIKIPKARELGVLFGSLFQRIMRTIDGDQDSFKGFGNTLATSFAPTNPLENNILSPAFMNIPKNKDFAGRNIVPQGMIMDKRSPYLQYDERTSELAKMIGALANEIAPGGISPKHIDYLIDAYTGIIGDILLPAATKGGNILKPITSQFTADPLYSNQTIQDFYELYDKAQQRATDKNVSENISGKIVTPEEKLRNGLQKAAEEIADLNKKKKQYEAVGNTNAVRLVQQQIIDTAKAAIEKYR